MNDEPTKYLFVIHRDSSEVELVTVEEISEVIQELRWEVKSEYEDCDEDCDDDSDDDNVVKREITSALIKYGKSAAHTELANKIAANALVKIGDDELKTFSDLDKFIIKSFGTSYGHDKFFNVLYTMSSILSVIESSSHVKYGVISNSTINTVFKTFGKSARVELQPHSSLDFDATPNGSDQTKKPWIL